MIELAYVSDCARLTRCHANPGVGFQFLGDAGSGINCPIKSALIADVEANGGNTFSWNYADLAMASQCFVYGAKVGFRLISSYGSLEGCGIDTCATGFYVTFAGSNEKGISLADCDQIPIASGNGVLLDGAGNGSLSIVNMRGHSSGAPNAFLKSNGSGTQLVQISNCRYTNSGGGTYANGVQNTNGSCTVTGTVATY